MSELLYVEDLKRVQVQPGDTLIFRLNEHMPKAWLKEFMADLKLVFPGHKILILPPEAEAVGVAGAA